MAQLVVKGASLSCSFGTAPGTLNVVRPTLQSTTDVATVMDFAPNTNIPPFAMCTTLSNPQVAAATSAAMGTLTPQPCLPVTVAPWTPGSPKVKVGQFAALTSDSTCNCAWGGVITISSPGQTKVTA